MKDALRKNAEQIAEIEKIRASTGSFNSASTSAQVHNAIISDCDYRKSSALGAIHREEIPLSYARALIQRGNLSEAKEMLAALERDSIDSKVLCFISLELTRIAFFESDWAKTISLGEKVAKLDPPPVTQLALFQLMANAYFEMGKLKEARSYLDQVESLGSLFPYAASLLYAEMLSVRVTARELGPETAERKLDQIFSRWLRTGRQDNDLIFSYLRARMDIQRVRGRSALLESVGCFVLSEAAGDKLYSALAVLDIFCEFGSEAPGFLLQRIMRLKDGFVRVKIISDEIEGIREATTTGSTMRKHRLVSFVNSIHPLSGEISTILDKGENIFISLTKHKLLVRLQPFKVITFAKETHVPMLLSSISDGPCSKGELFKNIWGNQKYVPHLHDTHISSLLHRARKVYGLPVKVSEGLVKSEQIVMEIS